MNTDAGSGWMIATFIIIGVCVAGAILSFPFFLMSMLFKRRK